MDIEKLIKMQHQFDEKHGWCPNRDIKSSVVNAINKDIIGVMGELGEFSNLIKKINLLYDSGKNDKADCKFIELTEALNEEIIDTFIYLMRIISHLEINVEELYLRKLSSNEKKYKEYESNEIY